MHIAKNSPLSKPIWCHNSRCLVYGYSLHIRAPDFKPRIFEQRWAPLLLRREGRIETAGREGGSWTTDELPQSPCSDQRSVGRQERILRWITKWWKICIKSVLKHYCQVLWIAGLNLYIFEVSTGQRNILKAILRHKQEFISSYSSIKNLCRLCQS